MRIDELNIRQVDRRTLQDYMKDKGFNRLGQGAFASVYEHPNFDYVVKIFDKSDRGYIPFLKFVSENQNDIHLPKIKGKLMKINDRLFGIRLEKLDRVPTSNKYFEDLIENKISDYVNNEYNRDKNRQAIIESGQQNLVDTLDKLMMFRKGITAKFDLGSMANMMLRGKTLVITDPFI